MPMISRYFQGIAYDEDRSIIWHSVFGRPTLVTNNLVKILSRYAKNRNRFDLEDLFGIGCLKNKQTASIIKNLADAHILLMSYNPFVSYDEQETLDIQNIFIMHNLSQKRKVKSLSLIMSEECNFRCWYCNQFASSRHYYDDEKMMPLEVAKTSINGYLELIKASGLNEARINFVGGEPLLNWRTIEKLLPYIDACQKESGIAIKTGIHTNMSLLTRDAARVLIAHHVKVTAGLDGTRKGNDAVRRTKNMHGTYGQIMYGFGIMHNLGHPLDGFTMTVTETNFFDLNTSIIDWAEFRGMKEVRINIDVINNIKFPIKDIVARLMKVRKYAKTKGISVVGLWSRPVENLLLMPEAEDIGFCDSERGNSLYVTPNGQVLPCKYSKYKLGEYTDILNTLNNYRYLDLLKCRNPLALPKCQDCPILGFCRGGCMVTREANKGKPDKLASMCEFYLSMTYAILRDDLKDQTSPNKSQGGSL